jgi:hypothetical protein
MLKMIERGTKNEELTALFLTKSSLLQADNIKMRNK